MALTTGVILGALNANRASGGFPFAGFNYDRLASGLAAGIVQWGIGQFPNLGLTGLATGLAGIGTISPVTTRIIVPSNPGVLLGALSGAGMNGPLARSLAVSVSLGVSQAFSSAGQYTGIVTGVAVGSDASKVTVSNAATLISILRGTLSGALGSGSALDMMVAGLGNGIASLLLQGSGTGLVSGTLAIPPAPGSSPTTALVVV